MFLFAQSMEIAKGKRRNSPVGIDWHEKNLKRELENVKKGFPCEEWALYHLEAIIELRKIEIKRKYCA